jgi:hypothetical protein
MRRLKGKRAAKVVRTTLLQASNVPEIIND